MDFKPCCGNPTCAKNGKQLMKLADDSCDHCGHECRNCPPSEGNSFEEFLYEKMAVSHENTFEDAELLKHQEAQGF